MLRAVEDQSALIPDVITNGLGEIIETGDGRLIHVVDHSL